MQKAHHNLKYCYTCGYDVDHNSHHCSNPKRGHIPNVQRKQAHLCPNASLKKVLPYKSGAGEGWLMAQVANEDFDTIAQQGQQPWAGIYKQNQH